MLIVRFGRAAPYSVPLITMSALNFEKLGLYPLSLNYTVPVAVSQGTTNGELAMTSEVTPAPANTTETITTPVVMTEAQPQVSSPVVMTEPTVEETPAAATEPPAQGAEGEAGKPALDPIQKRFNEITAKRYEAERAARAAEDARKATEAKNAELLAELAKRNTAGLMTRHGMSKLLEAWPKMWHSRDVLRVK